MFSWFRRQVREHERIEKEVLEENARIAGLSFSDAKKEFENVLQLEAAHIEFTRADGVEESPSIAELDGRTREFFQSYDRFYNSSSDVCIARHFLTVPCLVPGLKIIGESRMDDYQIGVKPSSGEVFIINGAQAEEPSHRSVYHFLLFVIP